MKDVATFEKVSFEEYKKTLHALYPKHEFDEREVEMYWNEIILPVRGSKRAGGYDFFAPFDFTIAPGCIVAIPTGIRVNIHKDDWNLFMFPKSRNVKSSIRMSNTIGLIDGDYYDADNEGHIIIYLEMPVNYHNNLPKVSLFGTSLEKVRKPIHYEMGQGFIQGVFLEVGLTTDDDKTDKSDRTGGFGSTDGTPVYDEDGNEEL